MPVCANKRNKRNCVGVITLKFCGLNLSSILCLSQNHFPAVLLALGARFARREWNVTIPDHVHYLALHCQTGQDGKSLGFSQKSIFMRKANQ